MGLIRVSDDAEAKIKAMANGRTIGATVDSLVAGAGTSDDIQEWMQDMFDRTIESLSEQIDELKKMIEDTAVDRLDKSFSRPRFETEIDWPIMKELIYEVLGYEDDSWASRAAAEGITESNGLEETRFILSDDFICIDKGKKIPIIKLTPKVKTFLESKGVVQ